MINICRIIKIKTCIPLFALYNDSQYLKKDICVSDTIEVNVNDS